MITGRGLLLRPFQPSDIDALVRYGNNRNVWLGLRDRFPHPYTRDDAKAWVAACQAAPDPPHHFAVVVDGEAVGATGFDAQADVFRRVAEVGYWLGEPFWGRGLATAALEAVTTYAFATFDLDRLQAVVFAWNVPSMRVLEKADYRREGLLRRSVVKDGRVGDAYLYARLRGE